MEANMYYLVNDQPMTCPTCGARTHFDDKDDEEEPYQLHTCLNPECGLVFKAVDEGEEVFKTFL